MRQGGRIGPTALAALAFALAFAACDNAGADRTAGITAVGVVRGFVYFDVNGSLTYDAPDQIFPGARLRLLSPVGRDTLLRATTAADGTFRLAGVPVGTYAAVIDSASAGDSARVVRLDPVTFTVLPADSIVVTGAIGFPMHHAAEVRTLPLGSRVFVTGVALHDRSAFSDTLLHIADVSGAIRAARVRPGVVLAGDSVRLRGTVAVRLGERALDDVTVFVVAPTFIPTVSNVTTSAAATAAGGTLDARLVRVVNAAVTDTATVNGNLTLTVNDGSGALTVVLDRVEPAFRAPFPVGLYVAPNRFDVIGVLVPTGTGAWRLRPRTSLDLTRR